VTKIYSSIYRDKIATGHLFTANASISSGNLKIHDKVHLLEYFKS